MVFWRYPFIIQKLYYQNRPFRFRTEDWIYQYLCLCYLWILFVLQISLYWFWSDSNCSNNFMVSLPQYDFCGMDFLYWLFIWLVLFRPTTLLKKRLWHRCFPVNFEKFFKTLFLCSTSGGCLLLFKGWSL